MDKMFTNWFSQNSEFSEIATPIEKPLTLVSKVKLVIVVIPSAYCDIVTVVGVAAVMVCGNVKSSCWY